MADGAAETRGAVAADGSEADFDAFAAAVSRPLRPALIGALGVERGEEAHALAMAYGWEHRRKVMAMGSPVGYLFTVGRSRTRHRRKALPVQFLPPSADDPDGPDYEPGLGPAMARLPEKQRLAVFLVVGCGWSNAEVARLTGRSESTVRTLAARGLARLRAELGVEEES
jgi:DNA-directed RNA polymerase specialized sigma24 family protein